MKRLEFQYRMLRGREVPRELDISKLPRERHGDYADGYCIRRDSLNARSVVYSCGVGDNISFDESLIARYGCKVYGIDPTPKAAAHVAARRPANFELLTCGVAGTTRVGTFFLPKSRDGVSGSIVDSQHFANEHFEPVAVPLKSLPDLMRELGHDRIDLLKMDIEGAEYEVLQSLAQDGLASRIGQI